MNPRPKLLFLFLTTLFSISLHAQTLNNPSSHQNSHLHPLTRQLQGCEPGCLTCSSAEICIDCERTRILIDGKCRCESPRILRSANCECPWYMDENPATQECEYIDLIDVAYQSTISPLFDAVFQVQMNQRLKWTIPPTFTWTVSCNYQSTDTKNKFLTYLLTQKSDVLLIPSEFLEFGLTCTGKVSYNNQNAMEISKTFSFKTLTSIQPQIKIAGGPFQIFTHTDANLILAEVQSSSGSPISPSSLEITWFQTGGEDILDMSKLYSSSNLWRLTIPRCTLSQGKLYTFKLSVKLKSNEQVASQKVTIGVYSPKISLQTIQTDNYHIYNKDLKLTASQFSISDECNQGIAPRDFLDLSTTKYIWECVIVDLYYSDSSRLLADESSEITEDPNIKIHPDPQHLFYRSTTSQSLTIPSSYFTRYQNYQFIFYLTAAVQSKTSATPSLKNFNLLQSALNTPQTKAYVQILASKPFTNVAFSCSNENNCQALAGKPTQLVALDYDPKYTYTWLVNTFSAWFSSIYIDNNRITLSPINQPPSQNIIPQIILQVSDGTNVASSFFTIPDYTLTEQGSLSIYPSEGGEAYKTNFFVSTYLNKDDDLPITFQFYTSCNAVNFNYMLPKYEPFDFTPVLLPPGSGSTCVIGVQMTSNLRSTMKMWNTVSVTGGCTSLSDVINKGAQAMDSSKSSTDIYQRFRLISVIMENLQVWEKGERDQTLNVTSAQFKYSVISEMKDIFQILNPRGGLREILLNNIKYGSNQLFNQDSNWQLNMNILDTYFQANSDHFILGPGEYRLFASILDDLIYYMKKPGNEIEDPDKVFTYVNTIIRSALSDIIPSNTVGFNYDGTFYSLYTIKTKYCKVLQEVIRVPFFFGMQANFTLNPGQTIPPEKCNNEVDFIWLAFRSNYTVPTARNVEYRTLIYVDLRDSITGKSLLDIFSFFLSSNANFCPEDFMTCGSNGDGGTTIYGVFDLKDQIYKIFGKSKIKQIINISALKDFKFWQNVAFWTVIGFTIWFAVSFYWLYLKHPTYCVLLSNRTISQKPLYIKIPFLFWLVHPLIGIYLYNDPSTSKATRLALYYKRVAVVMVFSTIFSSISKGEGAIFRTYIIIFNACTVIPINLFLSRTFGWAFKLKISKKSLISYLKRSLVLILYLIFLIACFIAIFIIEAQQEKSQNGTWGVNFAISLLQDLTLAPLISITIKTLLIKFAQNRKTVKLKRMRKFVHFVIPTFKSIYNSIFTKTLTPIETQAPAATEIASPLSTSRKLLKETTPDLPLPTLPKPPKLRAFRTRRLSESQMGNVNEAAVETLITERFQTLFSEGKTLRVKENSPVKENYSRMQSANISSTKLSSLNSKVFTFNYESKFINRTSIIPSSSNHSPELAVEIGPEDNLFSFSGTNTSIPKFSKVLGSSIFSPQTQERIKEGKSFGFVLFSTQEKIINEKPFGSSLFMTEEKMERVKSDKHSRRGGGVSTQENIKKPPPFI